MSVFSELYKKILIFASLPIILHEYFEEETGKEYNVNFLKKVKLVYTFYSNTRKIPSATFFLEHLIMATKILKIPKAQKGAVAEFGVYKGASTTNLSIICALVERQLEIFDSFSGLPQPKAYDKQHKIITLNQIHEYKKGAYSASLKEVKKNISKYGKLEVCSFNPGFFKKTLKGFQKPLVFAFVDVDLTDSLKDVLFGIWPNIKNGSYVFIHEAHHTQISSLFFDNIWWYKNLKVKAPGMVGAGSGLGLIPAANGANSSLGYTIKNPSSESYTIEVQKN